MLSSPSTDSWRVSNYRRMNSFANTVMSHHWCESICLTTSLSELSWWNLQSIKFVIFLLWRELIIVQYSTLINDLYLIGIKFKLAAFYDTLPWFLRSIWQWIILFRNYKECLWRQCVEISNEIFKSKLYLNLVDVLLQKYVYYNSEKQAEPEIVRYNLFVELSPGVFGYPALKSDIRFVSD